jgi:HSP20 family protein
MKEQTAILKQDHLSAKSKSIPEFWDRIEKVMKRLQKRAFQFFEERGRENGHDQEDWLKAEAELLMPVSIKVIDAHNELCIRAQVAGFESDDVAFKLEKNLLTIQGSKQTQTAKETEKTQGSGPECRMIYRKVTLPSQVIPEKAEASLKNGILELVVPKAAINRPTKS